MIQRIQSLFLLGAAACSSIALSVPFMHFENATTEVLLRAFYYTDIEGVPLQDTGTTMGLGSLIAISIVASIVSIFLYSNRTMQMRISLYNIIINIGALGLIYFYSSYAISEGIDFNIKLGSILPVISAILLFLAFRAIRRDESIVKSLDRLR